MCGTNVTLVGHCFLDYTAKHGNNTPKTRCNFCTTNFGLTLPLFDNSWIDNSYYLISVVHGLLSLEFLSHSNPSSIINDILFSDLTSHT